MAKKKIEAANEPKVEAVTVEDAAETINKVDNNVVVDAVPSVSIEDVKEAVAPLTEIEKEMDNLKKSQEEFNKKITENPNNAESIIKEEIAKTENVQAKVEKIIEEKKTHLNMTTWWNGMGYDM